jgi:hypothetical protein
MLQSDPRSSRFRLRAFGVVRKSSPPGRSQAIARRNACAGASRCSITSIMDRTSNAPSAKVRSATRGSATVQPRARPKSRAWGDTSTP